MKTKRNMAIGYAFVSAYLGVSMFVHVESKGGSHWMATRFALYTAIAWPVVIPLSLYYFPIEGAKK